MSPYLGSLKKRQIQACVKPFSWKFWRNKGIKLFSIWFWFAIIRTCARRSMDNAVYRTAFSPGQGVLPKYARGEFGERPKLIVSRGLGNSEFPLRLFNHPEMIIINVKQNNLIVRKTSRQRLAFFIIKHKKHSDAVGTSLCHNRGWSIFKADREMKKYFMNWMRRNSDPKNCFPLNPY